MADTESYALLRQLKIADEEAARLSGGLQQIPDDVLKLDALLQEAREELANARSLLTQTEKALRTAEASLKEKEDALSKAESKLMDVKTNDAYQAAVRENEQQRQQMSQIEDSALQLLQEVDTHRAEFAESEKLFRQKEIEIQSQKERLEKERHQLETDLARTRQTQTEILARLDESVRGTYSKLRASGKDVAVALAQNGRCSACHLQIRPQAFNEILSGHIIHGCGHCGRLLIPSPEPENAAV